MTPPSALPNLRNDIEPSFTQLPNPLAFTAVQDRLLEAVAGPRSMCLTRSGPPSLGTPKHAVVFSFSR